MHIGDEVVGMTELSESRLVSYWSFVVMWGCLSARILSMDPVQTACFTYGRATRNCLVESTTQLRFVFHSDGFDSARTFGIAGILSLGKD